MNVVAKNDEKSPWSARLLVQMLADRREMGAVLDVGCASGFVLEAASKYTDNLVGVDASESFVSIARDRLRSDIEVRCADVQIRLPFRDETFDSIFFCDVIEHLTRPVEALGELRRVLKPGGRMLITTPNANSVFRLLRGKAWFGLSDESHLLFFTNFTLGHLTSKCGFRTLYRTTKGLTGNIVADALLECTGSGGTLVHVLTR